MENIVLFVVTVIVYYLVYSLAVFVTIYDGSLIPFSKILMRGVKPILVIALLALPINIDGNVLTIAGNATAEKNIYSLLSLYQKAGHDAVTLFGLAYQKAGRNAFTVIGLTYQKAGHDAFTVIGLAYQYAGNRAETVVAIALYQHVGKKTRSFAAFSALTKD